MFRGGRAAFTIIEVVFFVAISSSLILIAMTTIGSKQHRVQFTDSMRSLESFFETQRNSVRNGVNDNPTACSSTGGDSESCVSLGRVMVFGGEDGTNNQLIDYQVLTGNRLTADDEATCLFLLECAEPKTEDYVRDEELIWGSQFVSGKHTLNGVPDQNSRAFGFIRDPRSSGVNIITYSDISSTLVENTINEEQTYGPAPQATFGADVSAYYCFTSSTQAIDAVFVIEDAKIELIFDPLQGAYDC